MTNERFDEISQMDDTEFDSLSVEEQEAFMEMSEERFDSHCRKEINEAINVAVNIILGGGTKELEQALATPDIATVFYSVFMRGYYEGRTYYESRRQGESSTH